MRRFVLGVVLVALLSSPAAAEPVQLTIPLVDGKVRVAEVADAIERETGRWIWLGPLKTISISSDRLAGSIAIAAMDRALGGSLDLAVVDDHLVVKIDKDELPTDSYARRAALRTFVATVDPVAAEQQLAHAQYGLQLPGSFDPDKRLVVLVHGLNSGGGQMSDLAGLLRSEGHQVAFFNYPNDGPTVASAELMRRELEDFWTEHPRSRVDVVAHSYGSVVTRAYVESAHFAGQIDRLIMLCPPNRGSRLARLACLMELHEHCVNGQVNEAWNWKWSITDGLGEAAKELRRDSRLLAELNEQPRCSSIAYTIVTGNRNNLQRYSANAIEAVADKLPSQLGGAAVQQAVYHGTAKLRNRAGKSDGAVTIDSAQLEGVDDIVIVPADHTTIYCSRNGCEPVAWPVIRDRLSRAAGS